MRKILALILFIPLIPTLSLAQTVTASASLKDSFGNPDGTGQLCFTLRNYSGNVPHVPATGVLVATNTSCVSADSTTGIASTPVYANDQISPAGTYWTIEFLTNGSTTSRANYSFLLADVTENLNTKAPLSSTPTSPPPPTDSTYARLDGGNQPFTGPVRSNVSLTAPRVNGEYSVDGTLYSTVQAAITAACSAGGGIVKLPPGTYPTPTTGLTLCSNLSIIGSGRGLADSGSCPTTITTTQTSGDTFPITNMTDIHIADLCVKNLAAAGANAAIRLNYGQRVIAERLFITGPWLIAIELESSLTSTGSTIWNTFRDIHNNNLAPNGIGCLLDSHDATTKVINNNTFDNVNCSGATSGANAAGAKFTNTNFLQVINENVFKCGEASTMNTAGAGTGVLFTQGATADTIFIGCNVENNLVGFSKALANTVIFVGGFIGSNGTNISDSQPAFTSLLNTRVSGVIQTFGVTAAGGVYGDGIGLGGAAPLSNTIGGATGWGIVASGNTVATVNTTSFQLNKTLLNIDGTISAPSITFGNESTLGFNRPAAGYIGVDISSARNLAFSSTGANLGSGGAINWSSNGDPTGGGADTGLSRISANVTGVGNGSAGDVSGEIRSATIGATYVAGGTAKTGVHIIVDNCTLGTNCGITFSGAALFTNSTSYRCTASDITAANPVRVNQTSGSAVTFTGTGTDAVNFICIGN